MIMMTMILYSYDNDALIIMMMYAPSTTRGIINIINNNNINNKYHSGVTNTSSHPYDPSPDSYIDHTNRNHHRMDLSSLSPVSPLHHPIPTLHAALHDNLMYVSYEFFLPQPSTPLLHIQVFFFFHAVCLSYCLTACTPVFHSSRHHTSSHPPPQQQLPTTGPSITATVSSTTHPPMSSVSSIGCLVHTAPRR